MDHTSVNRYHGGMQPRTIDESKDAVVLRRYGIEPDPVIEFYKKDVDRTLLRQNLARTPEERWENFTRALRLADEMRRAGKALRGR